MFFTIYLFTYSLPNLMFTLFVIQFRTWLQHNPFDHKCALLHHFYSLYAFSSYKTRLQLNHIDHKYAFFLHVYFLYASSSYGVWLQHNHIEHKYAYFLHVNFLYAFSSYWIWLQRNIIDQACASILMFVLFCASSCFISVLLLETWCSAQSTCLPNLT